MDQDGRLTLSWVHFFIALLASVLTLPFRYRKARSIGPLHTEGPIIVTSDAKRIVTCLGDQAILTNVETGEEICRFLSVGGLVDTLVGTD